LVNFYHFLILSTIVLSLTFISIISARINMAKRWCDAMGRGSSGERQTSN
jgi:cell division protein FtsW (lipid II flippase)